MFAQNSCYTPELWKYNRENNCLGPPILFRSFFHPGLSCDEFILSILQVMGYTWGERVGSVKEGDFCSNSPSERSELLFELGVAHLSMLHYIDSKYLEVRGINVSNFFPSHNIWL